MNLSAQEYLAKLLAKENLTVQHGNYSTASFEPVNRILRLPLWADKGKDVYDLLVGHEVGHALFTPADGWHDADKKIGKIPRAYLNIVEDIRIERKIQETYPGIVRRFKAGYKRLFDDDLFGTNERDINKAGLMDRLNVSSKGRGYVPVKFTPEETPLVNEAMAVETWDDVVKICKKFYDFIEENKEEKEEEDEPMMPSTGDNGEPEESSGESSESGDNESEDEDSGEGNSGGESEDGKSKKKEEAPEGHETWTEDTHREREEDLLEMHEDRYDENKQSAYSSGVSDVNLKAMLFTYKEAEAMRDKFIIESREESQYLPYVSHNVDEDWAKQKPHFNANATLLAKDFERKKAAYEYSKSRTAKSGKLDPNKLHSYKYSEDIFLTTTHLAQAKSHGIMMFLDLSGSMCDIIEDVTNQAITIAMFCRKVNIPFEAYSFTSSSYNRSALRDVEVIASEVDIKGSKVVEMFNSGMNNATFDNAACTMFAISKAHSYNRRHTYYLSAAQLHSIDQMGSTPLIQTCFLAESLTNDFTKRHGIQNTNIMFLTDGCPDGIYINEDKHADVKTSHRNKMINFKGKMIEGEGSREIYEASLGRLKELTGATIMGFHLATDASSFGQGYHGIGDDFYDSDFKNIIKKWRKENFLEWKKAKGYDNYFIIKCNTKAVDEEFTPTKTETIQDIKREFRKFSKAKKGTKQLVGRISDAVCA
jgi:hypothetical protein